jgi:hypothetical protein
MLFSALSTELDVKILELLHDDRQALSAMSKTSKYYRTITEPILYRDILFPEVTVSKIKRLLMTLLDRSELAGYIRSAAVPVEHHGNRESSTGRTATNSLRSIRRQCRSC